MPLQQTSVLLEMERMLCTLFKLMLLKLFLTDVTL